MPELFNFGSPAFITWLSETYDQSFTRLRKDLSLHGSPERSQSRVVIEDKDRNVCLLEMFLKEQYHKKHTIAAVLDTLFSRGLKPIHPYIRTRENRHLPLYQGYHFQLSDYIPGDDLKRPDYLLSRETGNALAGFLIALSGVSGSMSITSDLPLFSIRAYILKLKRDMQANDLFRYRQYKVFFDFLFQNFMDKHDGLPVAFVHGDFHPLNVIWCHTSILSVIDWEFAGIKPDLYDAANLVGCAGIEDPEGLGMGMVLAFLETLRSSGVISDRSWALFPEYVLALRFAWLAEWLRKKDEAMLDLEARYMQILVDHMDELRSIWFKQTGHQSPDTRHFFD